MDMTFETFVPTRGLEKALGLARSIPRHAGRRSRLLILHGGAGSGKTHLLMATATAVARRAGAARVVSTTADELARELTAAVQADQVEEWSERCRGVSLLTADDLQTLVGKPATQQELAIAFSTWLAWGVSIVCASGATRSQLVDLMRGLPEGQAVRWVTMGPLSPLDRHRLAEAVFAMRGLRVGADVMGPLVQRCGGDLRRIVGAAVQLRAASQLTSALRLIAPTLLAVRVVADTRRATPAPPRRTPATA
jgi:chromosomal replication initiator protein